MLAYGLDRVETSKLTTLTQVIFILKRRDGSIITVRKNKTTLFTNVGRRGHEIYGRYEHTQDQADIQR